MIAAIVIALSGILVAYICYIRRPAIPENFVKTFPGVFRWVNHKYYVDELYQFVFVRGLFALGRFFKSVVDEVLIDGSINGTAYLLNGVGWIMGRMQAGYVQGYAFAMILGAIAVLGYLIVRVVF